METLTKATAFSLFLILVGIGILVLVVAELMRPSLSILESVPNDSTIVNENGFPQHTFKLLNGKQTIVRGINAELLTQQNLFARPLSTAKPVAKPKVEVKPKPSPPPATKQIEVIYQGLYQSSAGESLVYLKVDGVTQVIALQEKVASEWKLDEANRNEVWVTNTQETRMQLLFNQKKRLEVPIQ